MKEIDFVFNFLKKQQKATLKEIFSAIKSETNEVSLSHKKMANIYTSMLLEPRFFYKKDKNWYLKSEISLDEIKAQNATLLQENETDEYDLVESNLISENDEEEIVNIIDEDSYDDGDQEDILKKEQEIRNSIKLKEIEN